MPSRRWQPQVLASYFLPFDLTSAAETTVNQRRTLLIQKRRFPFAAL
jgi:hypothetical protein